MIKEQEFTAKSVEEAEQLAAETFGVDKEAITFTVLEEGKKGFLGLGAVDAKVLARYEQNNGVVAALSFIKGLIADLELEGLTVSTKQGDNDNTIIAVDGESAGMLIGHHGETMEALQYLTQLIANHKEKGDDHIRVNLDVEGYREKREETLRALARRMAGRVLKEKKSVMMEPMNPYERRIIHSEIQGIAGVATNSIGADANRRVVIYLDDQK